MKREQLDELRWHTPAPWVNKCTEYGFRYVQTPYGHTFVAYTTSPQSMSDGDARLITATPDLIAHIDEQQRKVDRLKVLMQDAYYEGYRDGELGERGPTQSWDRSDTRAELEASDD